MESGVRNDYCSIEQHSTKRVCLVQITYRHSPAIFYSYRLIYCYLLFSYSTHSPYITDGVSRWLSTRQINAFSSHVISTEQVLVWTVSVTSQCSWCQTTLTDSINSSVMPNWSVYNPSKRSFAAGRYHRVNSTLDDLTCWLVMPSVVNGHIAPSISHLGDDYSMTVKNFGVRRHK